MQTSIFQNREDAGKKLANKLSRYSNRSNMIILALPRGGVPLAHEIAKKLHLPLDIFLVRKIGIPDNEETAMGAIAPGNVKILNHELIKYLNLSDEAINKAIAKAEEELHYRNILYRAQKPMINLRGCDIILVDDGMATGATMQTAILALRKQGVGKIIVAVPVSSQSAQDKISTIADKIISLITPKLFNAVGGWYRNFPQVSHDEVKNLLKENYE